MNPQGPIRREAKVEAIADDFTLEHGLDPREQRVVIGAIRIGLIEGVRGCMFETGASPSSRIAMESYWGLSGTTRTQNRFAMESR